MQSDLVPESQAADKGHIHLIVIDVDGQPREIVQGPYLVSVFKAMFNIPADYELDHVVDGKFIPLADDRIIEVHAHETFVSHVRHGGSS